MKTSTKDLKKIANSKINSLEPVTLEKLKKQHLRVLPNDIINIMTLLAFSKTKHNESLTIEDVAEFFDEKGNFLGGPYTTFSCLYGTLDYINYATLNKLGREKYLNLELDGLAVYNFQIKILLEMLWIFLESYHDEFPDFPERESDLQRILIITQLLYPSEFKKLIHSATEFIDDKNGPHIDATNKNGILTIKLNHKSTVYAGINEYDREYAILNFFAGGLILQGFGKFTHKTPWSLYRFLEHNPNLFNFYRPARITTSMRWDDRRTWPKIKKHGKSFRESSEEYSDRHADLANAWNDGLFGLFSYEVHRNFTTLKWKYPDFFILDSIEDIQNDHTWLFRDLLDTYEGKRYPSVPYGMEFKFHEL